MNSANSTPEQRAKADYDPGWNDPPKLSYNAQQPIPGRPRNFLNKRVAFPLSSATSPSQAAPMSLPPMSVTSPVPLLPPLIPMQPLKSPEDDFNIDSENTLREVKEILLEFLNSSSELGPKANDIKRRLHVMEEMWLSGKLAKKIHMQMKELAYALRDDVPTRADDIHRALMVDHISSVGTWMPGVKQLIHHCIARSELLAIDKEHLDELEH